MVGAIAHGFHEGSRSEYFAQCVFSAFGTSVPVPHPEDHGIDFYCRLTDRIGQRSWATASYTVQVKSEPTWIEILVQRRRDRSAAVKLMRKLLRKQGFAPTRVTTDKLRSYGAAFRHLGIGLRKTGLAEHDENCGTHAAKKEFDIDEAKSRIVEPDIAVAAIGADLKLGRATP